LKHRHHNSPTIIFLAAGQGLRLRPFTDNLPKAMVAIGGKPLLAWTLQSAAELGITRRFVVRGYRADMISFPDVIYINNLHYKETNMVVSLFCAEEYFNNEVIISYGDILYEQRILASLLAAPHEISVVVDLNWKEYWEKRFQDPLEDAESLQLDDNGRIMSIGQDVASIEDVDGQYIGLMKFKGRGVNIIKEHYHLLKKGNMDKRHSSSYSPGQYIADMYMTDFIQSIIDSGHSVHAVPVSRGWLEIDSLSDYNLALDLLDVVDNRLVIS